MGKFDDFTGQFSLSKTLRFELKPMGRTWDNLEKSGYLQTDEERARTYPLVKMMLDDNHREFINNVLESIDIDWRPLSETLVLKKRNPTDSTSKELMRLQDMYQKEIARAFSKTTGFKDMFSKKALDNIKEKLTEKGDEESLKALCVFDKFSTYFLNYHDARKNIYQTEMKSVSIPWRIVMDNLPRFVDNSLIYEQLKKESPEIIDQLKKNLEIDDLEQYFSIENFNSFLTQKGIENYNYIIEGRSDENCVIQGMNILLNLRHQRNPEFKRILMKPMYKQILSKTSTRSFVPKNFKNQDELIQTVSTYMDIVERSSALENLQMILSNLNSYDVERIFIEQPNIPLLSTHIFGSWEALGSMLQSYRANQIGDPLMNKTRKQVDKWLKAPEFPLSTLLKAIEQSGTGMDALIERVDSICNTIREYPTKVSVLKSIGIDDVDDNTKEESIIKLREILDPYMDVLHIAKMFKCSEELGRDQSFYSILDECIGAINPIVGIFNQSRNYCTRKAYETTKIKVNLSLPSLANGWDVNKEKDNKAIILRKDDRYFLAIAPPRCNIKFAEADDGCSCFEKMDYKLLPDPSKMLPKIFIKAKNVKEQFLVTEDLLTKYNEGRHKKGDNFDLEFCHELIDYYKASIRKYSGWNVYDFKFKDTSEYSDISEFYSEIIEQGYRVEFRKVSSEEIYQYVDEGKLFLFQIYNKDFSEKSRGKKNLHTIYWLSMFCEENLNDPRIKLNGQAELFFRHRSINESAIISHKAGEKVVNRIDRNKTPIPQDIYKELNRFYSGYITELSAKASEYLDLAIVKETKHDIVKDRRFTVDKMHFHVPITFNHRCRSNGSGLDNAILRRIVDDKNIRIIGIDRGERNLLYISMIDRDGNILCQKSLNIIDGYDYQKALNIREYGNKESRRNWGRVEGIKQFKEGYISKVVSELTRLAIDNDAIIVMEDLNYGFKRGRFKIEKQIYQKFENMLINKLNYLVFKDRSGNESGSPLNGYQLTRLMTDVTKVGKQTGIIFYVPAPLTSKIDPTTGFVNLFELESITTVEGKRSFLSKMDDIRYDNINDSFAFEFDYRNFNTRSKGYRDQWTVYTVGERYRYDRSGKKWITLNPTESIKDALAEERIQIDSNLKKAICDSSGKTIGAVFESLKQILNMRVQNDIEDYIQSPVKNKDGEFYNSNTCGKEFPKDSDANGAYNIALKGELLLRLAESERNEGRDLKIPNITNSAWLTFCQSGKKIWKN